ncbi:hypothetical protein E0W68_08810 [Flavobacterium salilacus subsp. salilacus]|uniref:hypothetical protein n=1 Tax=Flavobacterium TaxID=237 RepID=UPI0010756256|nr:MULTISPECIES: hypothetical protein [Flavobacterium]KAF2518418.1 hypothetical protein E0W68_08810 [Flavobacterium salilacus subsp. salilacus]MBE1615054.1 hypothetical protein [Flavobacterium sp. SaA2.13]
METYNCFGYHYSNHLASLEIALPKGDYDFEYCNISTNNWNGLVISLKMRNDDPGQELPNPDMNIETILIDLDKVPKISSQYACDFDYSKPIIVFTYHLKDTSSYPINDMVCHTELCNRNAIDASILRSICSNVAGPAKAGFGTTRRY